MVKAFCDTCGFETEEPLKIIYHDMHSDFCCFECAITALAPECQHCHCKVIGHGAYGPDDTIFCSHHCAQLIAVGR